jgi:NAD-dependent SIR2 family protein deacetylase
MDAGAPSWNAQAGKFSFYLHKRGRESVLCTVSIDALESAAQSSELSETALSRIFDLHRLLIEPSCPEAEHRIARIQWVGVGERQRHLISCRSAVSYTCPARPREIRLETGLHAQIAERRFHSTHNLVDFSSLT